MKKTFFGTLFNWIKVKNLSYLEHYPWIISLIITFFIYFINNKYSLLNIKCGFEYIKDFVTITIGIYTLFLSFIGVVWPLLIGAKEKYQFLIDKENTKYTNKYLQLLWYLKTSFITGLLAVMINGSTFFINKCYCSIDYFSIGIKLYWIVVYFNVLAFYYFLRFLLIFFRMDKHIN